MGISDNSVPRLELPDAPAASPSWITGFEENVAHQALIARGGYGEVHKMTRLADGVEEVFARKIIRLFGDVTEQDINNEASAVRKLREAGGHPNLVTIFNDGWLRTAVLQCYFFDMEYCQHTLEYRLNKMAETERKAIRSGEGQVTAQERIKIAIKIAADITAGLEFIHSNGQAHRDLKPRNVLYSSRCELWKIADFGISADVTSKRLHVTRYSRGTAPYRAPEMSHPNATYNNRVDIWALGCIVYEAFTGLKAFETEIDVFRYTCLPGGLKLSFERLPPYLRLTLQKPLETMLSLDGNARPSAKSLIELWANIPKPNPPGGPESQCGEIYVTSQEPAPQVFSPPGFLSHEVSKKIIFVAVNILNTRLALIFAPENSSPDECIQVHAPSDGNVCWGQKRPTRPGPTLLTFSEGGRFLVFRERGSRKSFKVLDVYKFETLATIWAEAVPVAIAFSDHGHRAAVALRRDGHPPRLLEPSLPDQSESTPTVFVSGDTIEVDMAGARGNPEIFYSGKGENIFLTQWMGKEGLNGDLEVTGWNVGTRSCHTRITLATQFVRWPDEPLHLPPCYITQNYVAVQGRGASDANKSIWFIIPLEPGSTDDMAVRHDNATFAVAVPVGFVFIHGCKMELWTPPGGTATLGQMDSDVGDEALIFAMSEDQRTLMAMTKDGRLRKWKLG